MIEFGKMVPIATIWKAIKDKYLGATFPKTFASNFLLPIVFKTVTVTELQEIMQGCWAKIDVILPMFSTVCPE